MEHGPRCLQGFGCSCPPGPPPPPPAPRWPGWRAFIIQTLRGVQWS
jgi:hypothetical protein